jgi:hypothetical protein
MSERAYFWIGIAVGFLLVPALVSGLIGSNTSTTSQ